MKKKHETNYNKTYKHMDTHTRTHTSNLIVSLRQSI